MNHALLDAVRSTLIAAASASGVDLASAFTPESFNQVVIGVAIKSAIDGGMAPDAALDHVMGAGSFVELANGIWDSAQSKAVPA